MGTMYIILLTPVYHIPTPCPLTLVFPNWEMHWACVMACSCRYAYLLASCSYHAYYFTSVFTQTIISGKLNLLTINMNNSLQMKAGSKSIRNIPTWLCSFVKTRGALWELIFNYEFPDKLKVWVTQPVY